MATKAQRERAAIHRAKKQAEIELGKTMARFPFAVDLDAVVDAWVKLCRFNPGWGALTPEQRKTGLTMVDLMKRGTGTPMAYMLEHLTDEQWHRLIHNEAQS